MAITTRPRRPTAVSDVKIPVGRLGADRSLFKIVQTRRTFEEVTSQVREMLFGGSLRPGDRLPPERELSELLGVGRPALREALRALEVSGLIELRKGKTGGAFVTQGDHRVVSSGMSDLLRLGGVSVEELFEAREWILSALIRPACRRVTADELNAMRANVAEAERLHLAGRYEERIERNFDFHGLVAQATRNPFAMMTTRGLTDALRHLIDAVGSDLAPSFFTNRRELIKALEDRDEDVASKVMARIVKTTEQTYKRLAQEKITRALGGGPAPKAAARASSKTRAAAPAASVSSRATVKRG